MTNFKQYWLAIPTAKRSAFAKGCGTSKNYLNMIAHGQKHPSETLALNIEIASHGVITISDFMPEFVEKLSVAGYKKRNSAKKSRLPRAEP